METTKLSSKGQVIIPKPVRETQRWKAGTEFAVEPVAGGVLLRPLKPFPPARLKDVAGSLGYQGKAKSLRQMEAAIARRVKERHARGRY